MEGMTGDADKSPTVGPFSDDSSRTGCIVEGRKTTGMTAEEVEFGRSQRKFPTKNLIINSRFINFDETKIGGYDSEGELMPYNALALEEDKDAYDEKIVGGGGGIPIPKVAMPSVTQQITIEDIGKMKVKEIKEQLEKRGQSTSGNKKPLAERGAVKGSNIGGSCCDGEYPTLPSLHESPGCYSKMGTTSTRSYSHPTASQQRRHATPTNGKRHADHPQVRI